MTYLSCLNYIKVDFIENILPMKIIKIILQNIYIYI
jgi:hypothetical protein